MDYACENSKTQTITKTCPCNIERFFSALKIENLIEKKNDIFITFPQNIDRRGGSNVYPHPMFWIKNKKKYVYPCTLHFCYIEVGFNGVYISRTNFPGVKEKWITLVNGKVRNYHNRSIKCKCS